MTIHFFERMNGKERKNERKREREREGPFKNSRVNISPVYVLLAC